MPIRTTQTDRLAGAMKRRARAVTAFLAAGLVALAPAGAQDVESFDPDEAYDSAASVEAQAAATGAIDADLVDPSLRTVREEAPAAPEQFPDVSPQTDAGASFDSEFSQYAPPGAAEPEPAPTGDVAAAEASATTYQQDDLIGAAEGVFGKGAEGLAGMIEDLLRKQGEPNGYIVGREGGGAFIFGVRYGSGTLHHKVEGQREVYWTGPSLGFDAGANAGNTFVLVYNLYDSEDIFRRYPAGEGQAYFVGGLHASYMRRGDVVLIPIRVGAGLRLGVNAGYMRFSKKHRWLPF
ncbi:DUF1134 domain-containing protein [Qipengyuania nanhaisediminis]|uniref:DUF1134 domain-containing protein n=1 Tax=Qipengyuania nanhaisediminis TaxID=604088 RepID=UPI0038B231DE